MLGVQGSKSGPIDSQCCLRRFQVFLWQDDVQATPLMQSFYQISWFQPRITSRLGSDFQRLTNEKKTVVLIMEPGMIIKLKCKYHPKKNYSFKSSQGDEWKLNATMPLSLSPIRPKLKGIGARRPASSIAFKHSLA